YRSVLDRAHPIRDRNGHIERWYGTRTDIQEIVNAREVLASARRNLEAEIGERTRQRDRIWQLSNDLMAVVQTDGRITSVNAAWERRLGWSADELVGTHRDTLIHPLDRSATEAALLSFDNPPAPNSLTNRHQHRDGSYRTISWTAVAE